MGVKIENPKGSGKVVQVHYLDNQYDAPTQSKRERVTETVTLRPGDSQDFTLTGDRCVRIEQLDAVPDHDAPRSVKHKTDEEREQEARGGIGAGENSTDGENFGHPSGKKGGK